MKSTWWRYGGRVGAIALVGLTASVSRGDDETKDAIKPKEGIEIELGAPPTQFRIQGLPGHPAADPRSFDRLITLDDVGQKVVKLSDYWLGLDCSPITPAMRHQLKLNEGEGLVIESVMPESPAAKAGFQQHDLLLTAGDQPIKDVAKLMSLLDENKDQDLTFNVLRAGEKVTVTAKPEKRPQPKGPLRDELRTPDTDAEPAVQAAMKWLQRNHGPMRMQFFHPGMVVRGDVKVPEFPDDLHVDIHKHGNKPAEIVVERGDKKWTVTEDKLGDLPEDVRPHVESMLGRLAMPKFDVEIDRAPVAGALPFNIPLPPPGGFGEQIEKRLEEITRRMEQMGKQLNEIREQRRQNREERRDDREDRRDEVEAEPNAEHAES